MTIQIPEQVQKIIEILNDSAHDAYIVGGCVRDSLLGRTPNDWDVTTDARPEEIRRIFHRTIATGIAHGTVTVLMQGGAYEVTTYRIDGIYTDRRHPDSVTFTADLREDLRRRDFTINAMAYHPEKGLVDAFGGMEDLRQGVVRCVGNADERFAEDALRLLRALRFSAQLGFTIAPDTYRAIAGHKEELGEVSKERVLIELTKTLTSPHPEQTAELWRCGLTPYIADGFDAITEAAALRMDAALPETRHVRFADLMRALPEKQVVRILEELKSDNDLKRKTATLVRKCREPMPADETGIRCLLHEIGPELFDDLALLTRAPKEVTEAKERILARGDAYRLDMLAIDGNELLAMGYPPGKEIGELLNRLLQEVMEDPARNEKDKLKRSLCE